MSEQWECMAILLGMDEEPAEVRINGLLEGQPSRTQAIQGLSGLLDDKFITQVLEELI